MNNRRQNYCGPIATLAAAVAVASVTLPAMALQLEEVVVTAQKREQGANDVGIAITTFTGEQIRELGILSAEDIAMYTPGVTVNETAIEDAARVVHEAFHLDKKPST